jgi:hypothetical protein
MPTQDVFSLEKAPRQHTVTITVPDRKLGFLRKQTIQGIYMTLVSENPDGTNTVKLSGENELLLNSIARQAAGDRKSFQKFLHAVCKGDRTAIKSYGSTRETWVTKASMGETSGQVGGYTVPRQYTTQLLRVISEESLLYRRALRIPMGSSVCEAPMIDATTVPANVGNSPFFGGTAFSWISNAKLSSQGETKPQWRQVQLQVSELQGFATVSNSWLADVAQAEDSYVDLSQTESLDAGAGLTGPDEWAADRYWLNLLGRAAAWYVDWALFNGTGTAQSMPLGIINAPGSFAVSRNAGSQVQRGDLATMMEHMLPFGWNNAIWTVSPSAWFYINSLGITSTSSAAMVGNMSGPFEKGSAGYLFGRPVFVSDKCSALGTQGDVCFFDPSLYVVGVRQEVLIDASPWDPQVWGMNQTDFRVWVRIAGRPMVNGLITLADKSTVVSPYVILH